jgi:hypothetical protein
VVWGSSPSAVTYDMSSSVAQGREMYAHPISQILGCKDTTQSFLVINDQDTVCSLGSTKLTCFRYCNIFWHRQRRTWLQCCDRALWSSLFSLSTLLLLILCRRYRSFPGQFRLNLLPDCLWEMKQNAKAPSISQSLKKIAIIHYLVSFGLLFPRL